jgi:hypothetical protein
MALRNAFSELATEQKLELLLDRLEYGLITNNRKMLQVDLSQNTGSTIGAVSTVSTVSNVADQTRFGAVPAYRMVEAQLDSAFNTGLLGNVSF